VIPRQKRYRRCLMQSIPFREVVPASVRHCREAAILSVGVIVSAQDFRGQVKRCESMLFVVATREAAVNGRHAINAIRVYALRAEHGLQLRR
jgi:hypothetical protein